MRAPAAATASLSSVLDANISILDIAMVACLPAADWQRGMIYQLPAELGKLLAHV